jgi:hypothetical protein
MLQLRHNCRGTESREGPHVFQKRTLFFPLFLILADLGWKPQIAASPYRNGQRAGRF